MVLGDLGCVNNSNFEKRKKERKNKNGNIVLDVFYDKVNI